MKWELATDEQLLTIVKDDVGCPTQLMRGVVDEMLKRDLFKNLIRKAIKKRFTLLQIACNKLCTNKEELMQILNIEVWERAKDFKPGKAPFGIFIYMVLYSKLYNLEKAFQFGPKKTLLHLNSMEEQVAEDVRLEDCLPASTNVEKTVINKITFEERLSVLSEGEKETFLLYLKGYAYSEIAEMLGLSKTGINKRMKQVFKKLSGREINLKELGINQYKVGA